MADRPLIDTEEIVITSGNAANELVISAGGAAKVDGSAVTQPVSGTFWQATQPVSAASLPLPSGASTAANQATEIASLAAIDAGIPAALGQTTMAASMPVTMASNQPAIAVTISNASAVRYSAVVVNFNLPTAGTETPVALIRNPSGSGKVCYIRLLGMNNRTKTQSSIFSVYGNPTVTANGTGVTGRYLEIGTASTAATLVTSGPTVTANGTLLHVYGTGSNQNDLTRLLDATDSILANNSYLITSIGSNNNTSIDLSIEWTEA